MAAHGAGSPAIGLEGLVKPRRSPMWMDPYKLLLRKKPLATFGGVVLLLMFLAALGAEVIAPYDPVAMNLAEKLRPPSFGHILGTDQFGRDLFSRIVYGARVSLYIGVGVVVTGTFAATIWGCVAGYVGGRFDSWSLRIIDAVLSIPQLVLVLTIVSVIGPGLINIMLALAFRNAVGQTRTIRSAVLGIKNNMYMDAARAIGCRDWYIVAQYVLPNVMAPVIVVASISLGQAILAESSLAFLGFGVPPPNPTWGGMLSDEGRRYMVQAPWMAFAPGVALSLSIFGINMLGDGLRDVLDPRLRGSQ